MNIGLIDADLLDKGTRFPNLALMKYQCLPYIMRYKDYKNSSMYGMYVNLARWCNQPSFFKKKSYREFCVANGKNSSTYKYMVNFEKQYPEVAKKYFDLKYEDFTLLLPQRLQGSIIG